MTYKTTDYSIFILRDDNRDDTYFEKGVDPRHVKKLIQSISEENMLSSNPILVNKHMEVIDGQHRLAAAKELHVPIYYTINPNLNSDHMIKLNNNRKNWSDADRLNFYRKNGYDSYQKLYDFMKNNNIDLRQALLLTNANNGTGRTQFVNGTYKFDTKLSNEYLNLCTSTLTQLKMYNGFQKHFKTMRFWVAMIKLFKHKKFDKDQWLQQISMLPSRFSVKANEEEYLKMFIEVYNWKKRINKIEYKGK